MTQRTYRVAHVIAGEVRLKRILETISVVKNNQSLIITHSIGSFRIKKKKDYTIVFMKKTCNNWLFL